MKALVRNRDVERFSGAKQRMGDVGKAARFHPAVCDACEGFIVGFRYKCMVCADYDLCEACLEECSGHAEGHYFLSMLSPIPTSAERVVGGRPPLLSEATKTQTCTFCSVALEPPFYVCVECNRGPLCSACRSAPCSSGIPHKQNCTVWWTEPQPVVIEIPPPPRRPAQDQGTPREPQELVGREGVLVRDMVFLDLAQVVALDEQCFPEYPFSEAMVREYADHRTAGVMVACTALDPARVLGTVMYHLERGGEVAHVASLCVSEAARGQGIGALLLTRALSHVFSLPTTTRALLYVASANDTAIRLYRRFGFSEYSLILDYYSTAASPDAFSMSLTKAAYTNFTNSSIARAPRS